MDSEQKQRRLAETKAFMPVEHKNIVFMDDVVENFLANEFPIPSTLNEIYLKAQDQGYRFNQHALKATLYRLHGKKRVTKIRTFQGVYWVSKSSLIYR